MKEYEFTVKVVGINQSFNEEDARARLEEVVQAASTRATFIEIVDKSTECQVPAEEN